MLPLYQAQLLSYLKLANKPKGLLINFNSENISKHLVALVCHTKRNWSQSENDSVKITFYSLDLQEDRDTKSGSENWGGGVQAISKYRSIEQNTEGNPQFGTARIAQDFTSVDFVSILLSVLTFLFLFGSSQKESLWNTKSFYLACVIIKTQNSNDEYISKYVISNRRICQTAQRRKNLSEPKCAECTKW